MYLKLAFLSLFRRPLRQGLLFLIIALSCALPVFLLQMTGGLYRGINRAVEPFPILAGVKGSAYQLILNTIFFRDRPVGNISYETVETLRKGGKTSAVYPLAFGDNYRGFPVIGTEKEIFSYQPKKNAPPWLRLSEGTIFEKEGDAVIGSETARLSGLSVGDTFRSIHGAAAQGRSHDHVSKVTGILAPAGGPYDRAIFVSLEDVWESHHAELTDGKGEVTALIVSPKGYKESMQLLSEYQRNKDVQMIFPSQSVISLYHAAGQSKEFWQILVISILALSLVITLLVLYWSNAGRLSEFALLKALGAGNKDITVMILGEEALLLFTGSLAGWLSAYGASVMAANMISRHAAIVMDTAPVPEGLLIIPVMTIAGTLAGLIPARMIRNKDISGHL